MDVNVEELRRFFLTKTIGRRIEFHEEIGSTNSEALRLALEGTPEGTVIIADAQSDGRGRLDRVWESPPSRNLYVSVVLRPGMPAVSASLVPLMTGVAVADVVSQYCPGRVRLKWPNDVLVDGRKICGMLTEMRTRGDRVAFRSRRPASSTGSTLQRGSSKPWNAGTASSWAGGRRRSGRPGCGMPTSSANASRSCSGRPCSGEP